MVNTRKDKYGTPLIYMHHDLYQTNSGALPMLIGIQSIANQEVTISLYRPKRHTDLLQ